MVRITIKGGVWKNTEDEILKAAVMKYGKNQWSRISSLLVRKSATQCKARWYEWLDPSIKKTEWSREEEEKLLHLAKIMPCQWRSIAPMMGRTAAQCLEHYEQLLDAAQQPEAAAAAAGGAPHKPSLRERLEDPRRLRPGEIDPLPEAKPARPDPQDMDEDEKEMLSEARARLANTKGKKAKRKAREKQLEEARRLAVLQKQRELKAAGIEPKQLKKRKVGMDYEVEIPFEKKPAPGFFSTAEEDAETAARAQERGFKSISLQDLDGKSRDATEMEERKKDAKRLKLFKQTNLPEALLKINQLNDPQQISRRLDMNLPAPQIGESELAEIAKLGGSLAAAGGATPMRPGATPLRGAGGMHVRTPLRPDTILTESQNLLSLTQQNSSLLGGENTPLRDSDFSGIKPRSTAVSTPNVLASPLHAGGQTPVRGGPSVPGTPMRDGLGINGAPAPSATSLSAAQAIQMAKGRADSRKASKRLAAELSALPAPTNEFALVLPELPEESKDGSADGQGDSVMEDAEDVLARAQTNARSARAAAWKRESQVIQRGLPRPSVLNLAMADAADAQADPVSAALDAEVLRLLQYDHAKFPPADAKKKRTKLPALEQFSSFELDSARELVEAELAAQNGGRALSAADMQQLLAMIDASSWESISRDFMFLPHLKQFGRLSELDEASPEVRQALAQHFSLLQSQAQSASKRAGKAESQLGVLVGGYQQLHGKIRSDIVELHAHMTEALRQQSCFGMLADMEAVARPARKAHAQEMYQQQQEKERQLQAKYQLLQRRMQEVQEAQ